MSLSAEEPLFCECKGTNTDTNGLCSDVFPTWWVGLIEILLKNTYLIKFACWFWHPVFKSSQRGVHATALSYSRMYNSFFFKPAGEVKLEELVHFSVTWSVLRKEECEKFWSLWNRMCYFLFSFCFSRIETEEHDFRKKLWYWPLKGKSQDTWASHIVSDPVKREEEMR